MWERWWTNLCVAALVATFVALPACSNPTDEGPAVYAGVASGLVMAVLVEGDAFVAYTCGDETVLDANTAWFRGTLTATDQISVTDHPTSRLEMQVRDADISGRLETPGGTQTPVLARTDESEAGIFLAEDGDCRTALVAITTPAGIRTQGAHFCAETGPFFQVTPIRPVATLGDGVDVSFTDDTGPREVRLQRVAAR